MRKWLVLMLTLCICFSMIGCGAVSKPESDAPSIGSNAADNTLPAAVDGTYNGRKITMRYDVVTDFEWLLDMSLITFYNGYARFYVYEDNATSSSNKYTYMDVTGTRITQNVYQEASHFDENGIAVAAKETTEDIRDAKWVFIDTQGKEIGPATFGDYEERNNAFQRDVYDNFKNNYNLRAITKRETIDGSIEGQNALVDEAGKVFATFPEEFNTVKMVAEDLVVAGSFPDNSYYLYNTKGKRLSDTAFEKVGTFYNGVAPFLQDGKMGVVAETGEIVIAATYSVDYSGVLDLTYYENRVVIGYNDRIAIITITEK